MSIGELTFAALTRRTEPNPRPHTAVPAETSRARRPRRARLHPTTRWRIAVEYARGTKIEAILAEFAIGHHQICAIAREFGLPLRGHKPKPANPADIEHLRRWARRQAEALRREANDWDVLATLE